MYIYLYKRIRFPVLVPRAVSVAQDPHRHLAHSAFSPSGDYVTYHVAHCGSHLSITSPLPCGRKPGEQFPASSSLHGLFSVFESSFCSRNIFRPTSNRPCFCLEMILTTSFPELSIPSWLWNKAAFTEFLLCSFTRAAGKNYRQLGGLKRQKCILLQFKRSESKTKVWQGGFCGLWGSPLSERGSWAWSHGTPVRPLSARALPSACTLSSVSPLSVSPHPVVSLIRILVTQFKAYLDNPRWSVHLKILNQNGKDPFCRQDDVHRLQECALNTFGQWWGSHFSMSHTW